MINPMKNRKQHIMKRESKLLLSIPTRTTEISKYMAYIKRRAAIPMISVMAAGMKLSSFIIIRSRKTGSVNRSVKNTAEE